MRRGWVGAVMADEMPEGIVMGRRGEEVWGGVAGGVARGRWGDIDAGAIVGLWRSWRASQGRGGDGSCDGYGGARVECAVVVLGTGQPWCVDAGLMVVLASRDGAVDVEEMG